MLRGITQWLEQPSRFFTSFYTSGEGKGTVITNFFSTKRQKHLLVPEKVRNFANDLHFEGGISADFSAGGFFVPSGEHSGIVPPCGASMRPLPSKGVSQRERRYRFLLPDFHKDLQMKATISIGQTLHVLAAWLEQPSRFFTSFYTSGEGKGTVITNIQAVRIITSVVSVTSMAVLWEWLGGAAIILLAEAAAWGVFTLATKGGRA